jgi:hypothetical protein
MMDILNIRIGSFVVVKFDSKTFRFGRVYEIRNNQIYAQFILDDGKFENWSFNAGLVVNHLNPPVAV